MVGDRLGVVVVGLVVSFRVFEGQALLVQRGRKVRALVRVAVWSTPGRDGLSWSGHFLHPTPVGVLQLGRATLQLPGVPGAPIEIDYRIADSSHDLGGDFAGIGQPPITIATHQ
jgi:hypothetical protein